MNYEKPYCRQVLHFQGLDQEHFLSSFIEKKFDLFKCPTKKEEKYSENVLKLESK